MAEEAKKEKKKWDLTSSNSLWSAAEWIRKSSSALFVLVVRVDDMAFSVDGQLQPSDAVTMVQDELPALLDMLKHHRQCEKARVVGERSIEGTR